jgi:Flp pilus assembly protein TadD
LLADLYDTTKQSKNVTLTLELLVRENPKSARAWSALARDQGRRHDLEGMETSLRTVLSIEPRALKDKARLATVLQKQEKLKEAAALFEELAELTKTDVVALNNAAMLYVDELDDASRGISFAERAHRLAPGNPAISDTLAWALSRSKKR